MKFKNLNNLKFIIENVTNLVFPISQSIILNYFVFLFSEHLMQNSIFLKICQLVQVQYILVMNKQIIRINISPEILISHHILTKMIKTKHSQLNFINLKQ